MNTYIVRLKAKYRYTAILLRQLVITDFKLRYQGSVLGYLWSLLRPLAFFTILYIVFAKVIGVGSDIPYFASYLLLGIIMWNFFVEITSGSIGAVVARGDLLRKISFPKYTIVLSVSFSAVINMLLNLVVFSIVMFIQDVPLRSTLFLAPIIIAEIYMFALGIGFFLSAAFVRYRDINYVWEVVTQAAFYATPILYPVSTILAKSVVAAKVLMLNPMAQAIQDIRSAVVTTHEPTVATIYHSSYIRLVPLLLSLLVLLGGGAYFKYRSRSFAEEI